MARNSLKTDSGEDRKSGRAHSPVLRCRLFTVVERRIGSLLFTMDECLKSLSELRDRILFTMVERRIGSMVSDFSLSSTGFDEIDARRLDLLAFDGLRDGC